MVMIIATRMALITATPMTDSDAILTLTQWFSPSFPIGAFSYSHGLETAIAEGHVTDAKTAEAWITGILQHGAGPNDVILLAAAYAAEADELAELDALARALAPAKERLLETVQQGSAFARAVRDVWGHAVPDMALPLAVGASAAAHDLPLALTAETYLHSFGTSLTSAAVRAVPLGQTEGQVIVRNLKPVVQATATSGLSRSVDDLGSASFAADISAMRHETQYSRMFRS